MIVLFLCIVAIYDGVDIGIGLGCFRHHALDRGLCLGVGLFAVLVIETSDRYSLSSLSLWDLNIDGTKLVKFEIRRVFHIVILSHILFCIIQTFDLSINNGKLVDVSINIIQT